MNLQKEWYTTMGLPTPMTYQEILALIINSDGPKVGLFLNYIGHNLGSTPANTALNKFLIEFTSQEFKSQPFINQAALAHTFKTNIEKLRVDIFALDPVPGEAWQGLNSAKWEDPRFYSLSSIVRNYKQWFMLNERSRCFEGLIPKKYTQTAHDTYCIEPMLGHHSTALGIAHGQDKKSLTDIAVERKKYNLLTKEVTRETLQEQLPANDEKTGSEKADTLSEPNVTATTSLKRVKGYRLHNGLTTLDLQRLFLYALHDFSIDVGASFTQKRGKTDAYDLVLEKIFFNYNDQSTNDRLKTKLACYQTINANRELYEMFNGWCYSTGQRGDKGNFARGYGCSKRGELPRQVKVDPKYNKESFIDHSKYFSKINGRFINKQHIDLYRTVYLKSKARSLPEFINDTQTNQSEIAKIRTLLMSSSDNLSPECSLQKHSVDATIETAGIKIVSIETQAVQAETALLLESVSPSSKIEKRNEIGFNILEGFSAVLGLTAVAIAITLLSVGTLGIAPAVGIILAGSVLATPGFFGVSKRSELKDHEYIEEWPSLPKG